MQDGLSHKAIHDVSGVHINDEQSVDFPARLRLQWFSYKGHHLSQLCGQFSLQIFHGPLAACFHALKGVLDLPRPPHLSCV